MKFKKKFFQKNRENMNGLMAEYMKDNEWIIICMAKVSINGKMAENIKEIMKTIVNMGTIYSNWKYI